MIENKDLESQKEKGKGERVKITFSRVIQIIGYFFLIIGGIFLLPVFFGGVEDSSHAGILFLWIGLPSVITGFLLVCLAKIRFKEKKLNLAFTILIIFLIALVIHFFTNPLDAIFRHSIAAKGEKMKEEVINTKNPEKCLEIQAVPFVPRSLSTFLFPVTEEYHMSRIRKECISKIAAFKEDIKVCEIIQKREGGYRMEYIYCAIEVAVATKNESICDEVNDSWCYRRVAVAKQDPTLCEKVDNRSYRSQCYAEVAVERVDPALCEKIIDKEDVRYLAKCYQEIAIIQESPELCKKIPYVQYETPRGDCYYRIVKIAVKKRDADLCARIQELSYFVECYTELAVAENNLELCQKIFNPEYYQKCLDRVKNK